MWKELATIDASSPAGVARTPAGDTLAELAPPRTRLASIDIVRGLVIVLMVLDHTRDFIGSRTVSPTDLAHTTTALFFTRWVTHFCAPAFVFLAGVSAHLMAQRMPPSALRRFLLLRGSWLVLLEFTVVTWAWNFNLQYQMGLVMQVIWAIGASMCVLSLLTYLPERAILIVGVVLVAGHNGLDVLTPQDFGAWAPVWNVLHVQGRTPFGLVLYPLLPWIGTMALGYAAGRLFLLPPERRRTLLLTLGTAACLLFVVVRASNGYGDPKPWVSQPSAWFTVLSFLNVSKYPPSLDYLLMTLGPVLLALALISPLAHPRARFDESSLAHPRARIDRWRGPLARGLSTIGAVPLFAYVLHLVLVHALAGLLGLFSGHGSALWTQMFVSYPSDWGLGLGAVYLAWALVLTLLYPACLWFAQHKREHKRWWLSYL